MTVKKRGGDGGGQVVDKDDKMVSLTVLNETLFII